MMFWEIFQQNKGSCKEYDCSFSKLAETHTIGNSQYVSMALLPVTEIYISDYKVWKCKIKKITWMSYCLESSYKYCLTESCQINDNALFFPMLKKKEMERGT